MEQSAVKLPLDGNCRTDPYHIVTQKHFITGNKAPIGIDVRYTATHSDRPDNKPLVGRFRSNFPYPFHMGDATVINFFKDSIGKKWAGYRLCASFTGDKNFWEKWKSCAPPYLASVKTFKQGI